jgi:phosphoribosyl 1,2-cyclic phosphate phosphodiesterase
MKIKVLGSGGYLRIPRACCQCSTCEEARAKGFPYKRLGQSILVEDEGILFDTPEDINEELNAHCVQEVKHIFYSHWHPDHTAGHRIIETLRDSRTEPPLQVFLPGDSNAFLQRYQCFSYYESLGYCTIGSGLGLSTVGNIRVRPVPLTNGFAYAYLVSDGSSTVLHCPCHSMHLPEDFDYGSVDLLILNLGTISSAAQDITDFKRDNLRVIAMVAPGQVLFTHIEEHYGLGYDDCLRIQSQYEDILFAYDGLVVDTTV